MRRASVWIIAGLCAAFAAAFAPPSARADLRDKIRKPTRVYTKSEREAMRRKSAEPAKRAPSDQALLDVSFFAYTLRGGGLDALRQEAKEKAMATTIGELYFDNRFVLAPELLETYLASRLDEFVSGLKVIDVRQAAGAIEADVQVAINRHKLERDLEEKRFFYEPRRRPRYHVSLAETLDGQTPENAYARASALQALEANGGQPNRVEIPVPANNLDVDANQELLYQALVACRRHGVEILATGAADCRLEQNSRLYYTDYSFHVTDITLKLINVQNGRVMRTVTTSAKANDPDPALSAKLSLERAAADAVAQLMEGFPKEWNGAAQPDADYRVMVREIPEADLRSLVSRLEALRGESRPTEVHTKTYVHEVAVLNLYFDGEEKILREFLSESRYPQFNIEEFEDGNIKLSILR